MLTRPPNVKIPGDDPGIRDVDRRVGARLQLEMARSQTNVCWMFCRPRVASLHGVPRMGVGAIGLARAPNRQGFACTGEYGIRSDDLLLCVWQGQFASERQRKQARMSPYRGALEQVGEEVRGTSS